MSFGGDTKVDGPFYLVARPAGGCARESDSSHATSNLANFLWTQYLEKESYEINLSRHT